MKTIIGKIFSFSRKTVNLEKETIKSKKLRMKFRKKEKDFTRKRKLTFENMITLIFQKGVKSLQIRLNEFSEKLSDKIGTVTNSAYVQAKNKISHEVFKYLSLENIINRYYDLKENEAGYKTWNNFRILATDGSQVRLPEEKEIIEKYGTSKIKNAHGKQGEYAHGLASVLYDPLNNLALDSLLEKGTSSERALAILNLQNLEKTIKIKEKDLIIYDRGYYSLFLLAILLSYNKEFVFRMKRGTCTESNELFEKDCKINSKIITLKVRNKKEEYKKNYGIKIDKEIPEIIKTRLVRVVLDTGEIEVLATSLIDEDKYKVEVFKDLYFKRWGIEVYYDVLKNRLGLENFSGKNVESVLQDFYSSIHLSNLETVITRPINLELELKSKKKKLKNKQKVNKQISFNTIKNRVIELYLSNKSTSKIMKEMEEIFMTNVTQERPGRKNTRKKTTISKSLQFNKRKKKSCF